MTKQEKIREGIIILHIAEDEEISEEDASEFWGKWKAELEKNPEHFGDCTNEPQTCNRCLVESLYEYGDKNICKLHSQGVVIRVKPPLIIYEDTELTAFEPLIGAKL